MSDAPETGRLFEPLSVGALGALGLLLINPPAAGAPWCPSALLFGVACPLCGLTRGVARFVRGDLAASLAFHPLAWIVLTVAVGAWFVWLGRRAGWWARRFRRFEKWTLTLLALGLVTVWIFRAATDTLPPV